MSSIVSSGRPSARTEPIGRIAAMLFGLLIIAPVPPAKAQEAAIGEERVHTKPFDHAAIASGGLSTAELFRLGQALFEARFTRADGAGRPAATAAEVPTLRAVTDTPDFFRTSGPDANACSGCHNQPETGGAGDFVANVFVAPQDVEFNFDTVAPELSMERGTTALHGAGLLELLAREMTADLLRQRQAALRDAAAKGETVRAPLETKGVAFGFLSASPEGFVDVSEIRGVHHDLIVRPFGQKAVIVSLRHFTVTAMNNHHGMQGVERFSDRWTGTDDFDRDGREGELSEGDVTLLSLWQAMLPPPVQALPEDETLRQAVAAGERTFAEIGCGSCHVPRLPLSSAIFTEPGPYNHAGTLRLSDVDTVAAIDLKALFGDRLEVEADGTVLVPAYTDLKRHRIADQGDPYFANEVITQNFVPRDQFRTAPLWGVASTAPYGHRGDITTMREAILHHAGEARPQREAFEALDAARQAELIEFLKSLRLTAEEGTAP